MASIRPYLLGVLALASVASASAAGNWTDRALNSIARLMGEPDGYDKDQLAQIHRCLSAHDLEPMAEGAWAGFVQYASNSSNAWGKVRPCTKPEQEGCQYLEYDPRTMDLANITVYETCNTVSNFAYYRTMIAICDTASRFSISQDAVHALVQSFGALASGSAFFHASGSINGPGMGLDNLPIGTMALVAHQASIRSLGSALLSDMSHTPANKTVRTGIQLAQQLSGILSADTSLWNDQLQALSSTGVGNYALWFSGIAASALNLIFPAKVADLVVGVAFKVVSPSPEQQKFLLEEYAPTFRNLTKDLHLSLTQRLSLALKGGGTVIKLGYAFLWQEEIIKWFGLKDHEINKLGGEAMPVVNMLANAMTGFVHPDKDFQAGKNVYPGDANCRVGTSPHTKWHEQAANAVLDLMYLCDEINRLIAPKERSMFDFSWASFWARHWWGEELDL